MGKPVVHHHPLESKQIPNMVLVQVFDHKVLPLGHLVVENRLNSNNNKVQLTMLALEYKTKKRSIKGTMAALPLSYPQRQVRRWGQTSNLEPVTLPILLEV